MNYLNFGKLRQALSDSCRNVRWKDTVVGYEINALKNTYILKKDLENSSYKIQPYMYFKVYEPKERDIVATRIRDRQFQHSLVDNYIYDEVTRHFIRDNVACQKNRGVDDFMNRLTALLRRYGLKHGNTGWVLRCDIKHYFASIPHDVAKNAMRKRISDDQAYFYVCQVIDSYEGSRGLGLGSQLCQLIALAVLDDMDHMIKERLGIEAYIRYMDDFVLIYPDKSHLIYCRKEIENHLSSIGLALNDKTTLHPLKQGINMLHWIFILTDTNRVVKKMERRKISKFTKHLGSVMDQEFLGRIPQGSSEASLQSWMANAKRGDTYYSQQEMKRRYQSLKEKKENEYNQEKP